MLNNLIKVLLLIDILIQIIIPVTWIREIGFRFDFQSTLIIGVCLGFWQIFSTIIFLVIFRIKKSTYPGIYKQRFQDFKRKSIYLISCASVAALFLFIFKSMPQLGMAGLLIAAFPLVIGVFIGYIYLGLYFYLTVKNFISIKPMLQQSLELTTPIPLGSWTREK